MTSLDISSVRDFTKTRLRKILIDFYFYSSHPIGPPDPNKIEFNLEYDQLINLTNKSLFKDFNGKESYLLSIQAYERPKAYIYVKLLNTNKFTKKVGDYLIEFRIVKKTMLRKTTNGKNSVGNSQSKTEFKRLKINPVIFKPKLPKDQIKIAKLGVDKVRMLERKIKYGFNRRSADPTRKNPKEIFQQNQTNSSSIISRSMNVIFQVPPNWNYCKSYELELDKILDPSDLFVEIDVRLIEFLDINPKTAKIVKSLPLSDLLEDQFLDVMIIRDLKKFYLQTIEAISNKESNQIDEQFLSLDNFLMKSNELMQENNQANDDDFIEINSSKMIDSKDSTIRSSVSEERLMNEKIKKDKKNLFDKLFTNLLFKNRFRQPSNDENIVENNKKNDPKQKETNFNLSKDVKQDKSDQKTDLKEDDKRITDEKVNLKMDSDLSIKSKANKKKKKRFRQIFNIFKPIKNAHSDQETDKTDGKTRKVKKHKFENSAFLSIELQLGTKIDASKDKRLLKCLNHIDIFVVLALEGRKNYLNLRELRNQSSWRFIYTPYQIFILNQSKIHQTINALEDAICRTIAIAKLYAKYARIKNFCYLNSSINDLLYQYSLSSKQPWFNELSQMLEEYLFENLEMIFRAEMPASLMTMCKYNYSKYGDFLFDNQVQLILGVIAIKGLSTQSNHLEDQENVFINPESDDETFKDKIKKKRNIFSLNTTELSTNSISQETYKENHLISTTQAFTNAGLNLLGSMAKGFERCTQVWMQYLETKKPEGSNLEELVHFSRALKSFCTGLARVFNRQQHLIAKRLLLSRKKIKLKNEADLNQVAKKYLIPRLPRLVIQSLVNLHLLLDSRILNLIPYSLKILIDKLILPVDYDEASDVAKHNAIFQASPYKDIYNSLRITVEKLQDLHKEPIQFQVCTKLIQKCKRYEQKLSTLFLFQGWFPLNVTQAWIAEEIQKVEHECSNWDEFFKELAFIKSDYKIDKMDKLNLINEKEKQIKEKEFKDFLNEMVTKKLDDLVTSTLNEIMDSTDKNDLNTSTKYNFLSSKITSDNLKEDTNIKININDVKNLAKIKPLLNETETKVISSSEEKKSLSKEDDVLKIEKSKETAESTVTAIDSKELEKFKEPIEKIKHELDKLIKSQSILSQLTDKLIMNDDRREKTIQNVLESLKKELENDKSDFGKLEIDKARLEERLKQEIEKQKKEKELEEEEKRRKLEEKIKEEFNSFKQAKGDRFNKRLQKFGQLKPIELINLMESCYENLIAFVSWPHAIFPAKTAKEIVYCIDLIAVILKKFYQLLEVKSRSDFENIYKNSLERFIVKIQTVNYALMDNSFVDPDLRMNVVEWTDYQEKSWRGVVIGLECSKQINRFCILNETKNDRKLRSLPKRKLLISRKKK